jgi:hypothetical protein
VNSSLLPSSRRQCSLPLPYKKHSSERRFAQPSKEDENNKITIPHLVNRDSVVVIAPGYVLDDLEVGVLVPVVSRILTSTYCPNRLGGPPHFLSNGYERLFNQG